MRIAIVTNYWKGAGGGGVENFMVNLVDAERARGEEVSVLYRFGNDPEHFCGGSSKAFFPIACYRQLRKVRPGVVHSQGTWYCLLPGVLYKRFHGCTLVHTFHSEPTGKLSPWSRRFFQDLLDDCDRATFVSRSLQDRISKVYGLSFDDAAITYAGVRPREVSDQEVERFREQHSIGKGSIMLLAQAMTSNPMKADGLKLLITAVKKLGQSYPNVLLVVTREGKYSDMLRSFAQEAGVGEKVVFTGDVANPFVPLKMCDLYTHITLGEGGVPLALLEAMAMGKPIVATSVGGIPEGIVDGENGILVEPDADRIAERIDRLLRDRGYAEALGTNAKRIAEERFTWERSAERFLSIYGFRASAHGRGR